MRRLATAACTAALLLVVTASPARAQLSSYNLPIETAILESHVDVQYQYSRYAGLGPASDINVSLVSIEGQIKLGSFEVGLNVPFLVNGWNTDETQFGDIMLDLKWQVFGIANKLAVAVFLNTTLPTHSGDFTRKYARLQGGAVASLHLLGFDMGGGIQTVWDIIGDGADDIALLGFYGYARVPLLGVIALQAAVEYFNSIHPSGDLNAFLITPSVEFSVAWFHAGIGARIAVTDDAKAITFGRVGVLANAGLRF